MGSTATIFWGLLYGSIGFAFFMYGRRQKMIVPLVCGLGLMIFPYFVSNLYWLVGLGAGMTLAPYFYRY